MEDENLLQNLSNDDVINIFVDGIMNEKGIDAPTEEIHQQIHNEVKNQLLTEIDRSIIGELPDDKLAELSAITEQGGTPDPRAIADAVEEAGLDVLSITAATMGRFRNLYLGRPLDAPDDQPSSQPVTSEANA